MTRKKLLVMLPVVCSVLTLGLLQETQADDIQSLLANPVPKVTGPAINLDNQLVARGPFRRLKELREEREQNEHRSAISEGEEAQ